MNKKLLDAMFNVSTPLSITVSATQIPPTEGAVHFMNKAITMKTDMMAIMMFFICSRTNGYCGGNKYSIPKNTAAPAKKPATASGVIFLTYQIKSIFSIPMAATPAADPTTSILPPVPAE